MTSGWVTVLLTLLTWTLERRLRRTRPDTAPFWSLHAPRRPGNAPGSPSPAPRPAWPHRQPLCSGHHPPCPRCFHRAPPAAARGFYISSAKEGWWIGRDATKAKNQKKKKKRVEHTHLCILQTFNASLRGAAWTAQLVQTLWIRWVK